MASDEYDALHDGVPEWLSVPVGKWISDVFESLNYQANLSNTLDLLYGMLRRPMPTSGPHSAVNNLIEAAANGDLDVLDACVWLTDTYTSGWDHRDRLELLLKVHGSAWTIGRNEVDQPCLTRRVDPTVEVALKAEINEQSNAARHLQRAWHRVYGRNPDAGGAYREAVRAVEAAAKPVIAPTATGATLGTMIADLRNKPEKWTVALNEGGAAPGVDLLISMCRALWKSQLDRHGTDDESRPLDVNSDEAEAAVHLAITVVHWFRTGIVARA